MSADNDDKARTAAEKRPPRKLLLAAWFIPGLGHWLLGKRRRAIVFGLVVVLAFVTGVLLHGEVAVPKRANPLSWLATFACFGNGVLWFLRLVWLNGLTGLTAFPYGLNGGGDPIAAGFAFGNTFLYTAGLMNLLTVLDVSDIARGEKD